MTRRAEFSKATKLERFRYANGKCETCFQKIVGTANYDHAVPDAIGGANDFENCRCVCIRCHRVKTDTVDVPQISKSVRVFEKRAGVRKTRTPFRKPPPGYDSFARRMKDE